MYGAVTTRLPRKIVWRYVSKSNKRDAVAHKMVPAIAETHKMVPVKTVSDALLHVSFPIHYQIDASMHKVVPVAGIVA